MSVVRSADQRAERQEVLQRHVPPRLAQQKGPAGAAKHGEDKCRAAEKPAHPHPHP